MAIYGYKTTTSTITKINCKLLAFFVHWICWLWSMPTTITTIANRVVYFTICMKTDDPFLLANKSRFCVKSFMVQSNEVMKSRLIQLITVSWLQWTGKKRAYYINLIKLDRCNRRVRRMNHDAKLASSWSLQFDNRNTRNKRITYYSLWATFYITFKAIKESLAVFLSFFLAPISNLQDISDCVQRGIHQLDFSRSCC